MLQTMVKRQHEASEDEHERVKTLNNARQRKRRAQMDSDQKEELRLRNREAKRRSRQKKREVNSPSVGHPAPTDSEAWDAVTAAVHRVLDMNQSSSVDPSGSHPPSTIEARAVGTITTNPRSPPAPPSSNALAAPNPPAQDIPIDPALLSQPLTSPDDTTNPRSPPRSFPNLSHPLTTPRTHALLLLLQAAMLLLHPIPPLRTYPSTQRSSLSPLHPLMTLCSFKEVRLSLLSYLIPPCRR
ncbi:hypothetical protein L210DRAFT_2166790 [Boletus edulis BED1]|uniref:BZIP domain-containing protein n=1 Tax=Boletus edulis BED1 TaxID=1328754 RepID=A0AAD4G7C2_BOLED|nr:hypothetical protein L210DRAFT_2166790 [Boletus edulis BED1]